MKMGLVQGLVILALAASGQAEGVKAAIYLGGGMSLPVGQNYLNDRYSYAPDGGGGIGLQLSPLVELGGSCYCSRFRVDKDAFIAELGGPKVDPSGTMTEVLGGEYTLIAITGDIKLHMTKRPAVRFRPYAVLSIGYIKATFGDFEVLVVDSEDTYGIRKPYSCWAWVATYALGVGAQYQLRSRTSLFVECKYHSVSDQEVEFAFLPIRAGLRVQVL